MAHDGSRARGSAVKVQVTLITRCGARELRGLLACGTAGNDALERVLYCRVAALA